jgi:hypothetical protein
MEDRMSRAPKVMLANETLWSTAMLRPFVRRIAREEFPGTTLGNTRGTVLVRIIYNRAGPDRNYCTGHAQFHSRSCTVRVPYPHPGKVFPVLEFCNVVGHEFGHCKGLTHQAMGLHYGNSLRRGAYSDEHYAWAKALPVPVVPVKRKPTTAEKRLAKLRTAEAAVLVWTRKHKLATTKLKLWTKKARVLAKLVAESSESKPSPLAEAACGVDTLMPPVVNNSHG